MRVEDTLKMQRFPVTVKTKCKNISRVYPLKQKQVAEIFDRASGFDIIRRIFVFGSSVTSKCNIDSDLDLCIDADTSDGMKVYEMQRAFGEACAWNCDILMYSNIGKTLRDTVQKEGVIIYE